MNQTTIVSKDKKAFWVLLGGFIVLLVHAWFYWPFLSDDSLISLRYSQRFNEGLGLTWTDGKRVEGYSNLLWVLLCSLLNFIGVDLIDSVRILGFACSFVILSTPYLLFIKRIYKNFLSLVIATLLLSFCAPIVIWSIGGLEQPLVAALLSLFFVYFFPVEKTGWIFPSIFLALISITRPDGILFAGCATLCIFLSHGINKKSFLSGAKILFLPLLFFFVQMAFRYNYYGELVPNTALVKISFSIQRLVSGIKYVGVGTASLFPFSILIPLIVLQMFRKKIQKERIIYIAVTFFVWLAYLVFIGGDIFPGSRHFLPLIPLFAIAIGLGADALINNKNFLFASKKYIVLVVMFSLYLIIQFAFPNNARAKEERWEWDGRAISLMLKDEWKEQKPLFAITAAGCLPYWTEFPSLDMLGLNDYYIPRHPPKSFGKGFLGHDLGDANYVLSNKPDLISFCGPNGSIAPCFTADEQLINHEDFKINYYPAYFKTPLPLVTQSIIWVRKNSQKIGVRSDSSSIEIPCWFFSTQKNPVQQNSKKKFAVTFQKGDTLFLPFENLTQGRWEFLIGNTKQQFSIKDDLTGIDANFFSKAYVSTSKDFFRNGLYLLANTELEIVTIKLYKINKQNE